MIPRVRRRRGFANTRPVRVDRGTYLVAIPRALAEAMDLAGAYLEWVPAGKDRLLVRVVRGRDLDRESTM